MNTLYYGDNLDILQRYVKDESLDLIYLDPPFYSNTTYNVLFSGKDGSQTEAQLEAGELILPKEIIATEKIKMP